MEENKNLQLFNQQCMTVFKELSALKKEQERLETIEKNVKAEIERAMEAYGIKSVSNDFITISKVEASESISVDLKALEKKENSLYAELLQDYPKVTKRSGYLRFSVK